MPKIWKIVQFYGTICKNEQCTCFRVVLIEEIFLETPFSASDNQLRARAASARLFQQQAGRVWYYARLGRADYTYIILYYTM